MTLPGPSFSSQLKIHHSKFKILLSSSWFYPLAACFLLLFLLAFRKDIDYDLGYHLAAGRWIVEHHAFPQKDPFTYTVPTHDYVDLHWLYQTAAYGLYRLAGYSGISLANLLLILSAFGLALARMRLEAPPPWAYSFLLLPAILASELRFLIRPEIVSWILLLLTLLVLDLRARGGRNLLYLLPLFQVLWVNIEGLFVLGWVAMAAYGIGGFLQSKRADPKLVKFGLLSVAASFLNPYFLKGVLFPLLLFTRLEGSNVFKHYISEFQSPWSPAQDPALPFLPAVPFDAYRFGSLFLLALIAWTWRKRKAHELILAPAFFFLSCAAVRNVPLFFWAALPPAAASLRDLCLSRPRLSRLNSFLRTRKSAALLSCLALLLGGCRVATGAYYASDRRVIHSGLGLPEGRFPIQATLFMDDHGLKGRLLNDLAFGAWLDWRGPSPVFIDGRLEVAGPGLFTQYRDSFYPGGLFPLLSRWNVRFILFDHMMDVPWFNQLRTMPDWRLVYFDGLCALYARKDAAPGLPPVSWEECLRRYGIPSPLPDSILTRLAEGRRSPLADWLRGFFEPRRYPLSLFRLGAFAYENGQFEAARNFFLEMLRETSGRYYEVYFNLGAVYERLGRKDLAGLCYQKALQLDPNNKVLREKLGRG